MRIYRLPRFLNCPCPRPECQGELVRYVLHIACTECSYTEERDGDRERDEKEDR